MSIWDGLKKFVTGSAVESLADRTTRVMGAAAEQRGLITGGRTATRAGASDIWARAERLTSKDRVEGAVSRMTKSGHDKIFGAGGAFSTMETEVTGMGMDRQNAQQKLDQIAKIEARKKGARTAADKALVGEKATHEATLADYNRKKGIVDNLSKYKDWDSVKKVKVDNLHEMARQGKGLTKPGTAGFSGRDAYDFVSGGSITKANKSDSFLHDLRIGNRFHESAVGRDFMGSVYRGAIGGAGAGAIGWGAYSAGEAIDSDTIRARRGFVSSVMGGAMRGAFAGAAMHGAGAGYRMTQTVNGRENSFLANTAFRKLSTSASARGLAESAIAGSIVLGSGNVRTKAHNPVK